MDRISDSEQAVIDLLWLEEPMTAAELADRLSKERNWSLSTVKTLLARLVAKGAVSHEQDGRRFLYRALIARETFVANRSRRLLDDLFGGKAAPLIAHLARQDALSHEDVAEIEALLKALKP